MKTPRGAGFHVFPSLGFMFSLCDILCHGSHSVDPHVDHKEQHTTLAVFNDMLLQGCERDHFPKSYLGLL